MSAVVVKWTGTTTVGGIVTVTERIGAAMSVNDAKTVTGDAAMAGNDEMTATGEVTTVDAREAGTTELVTADVAAELAAVRLIVEAATEAAKRWEAMYRSYASTGESRLLADALDTLSERVREADHA